jgi:phosphoadenosine phosphosulfate reductase
VVEGVLDNAETEGSVAVTMLFLKDRIDESIEIMRFYEPPDGYFLAFSGGKDSIVLYAMAQLAGVKFDAHYHITTADPPELVKFIRKEYPSVAMDRSEWTMWTLIRHKGFPPTRIQRYCCTFLKEGGGEGRVVLTGVKKSDSTARRKSQVYSCRKNGKVVIQPLLNWCDDEIWDYINANGMKYCELYDQGFARLGCIGCPMAGPKKQAAEFARWPKYRAMYIRAFDKMLVARRERGLENKVIGNTAEEVMAWWLKES